jgi:hypothetical protein
MDLNANNWIAREPFKEIINPRTRKLFYAFSIAVGISKNKRNY